MLRPAIANNICQACRQSPLSAFFVMKESLFLPIYCSGWTSSPLPLTAVNQAYHSQETQLLGSQQQYPFVHFNWCAQVLVVKFLYHRGGNPFKNCSAVSSTRCSDSFRKFLQHLYVSISIGAILFRLLFNAINLVESNPSMRFLSAEKTVFERTKKCLLHILFLNTN